MKFSDFGINLAKVRLGRNLSAYELSLRLNKDPSYIHKAESGKINISLKVILEICEILEIEPVELFKS